MVLRKFQGDLRYFQECFKEASIKWYKNSKGVSKKFQVVLRQFQVYFREISRVFQECFTSELRKFQMAPLASLKEDFKRESRMFQGLFIELKSVSRKFKNKMVNLNSVKTH